MVDVDSNPGYCGRSCGTRWVTPSARAWTSPGRFWGRGSRWRGPRWPRHPPSSTPPARSAQSKPQKNEEYYFLIIYGIYLFNAPLLPGPGHAQLRPEPRPRDGDCGGRHQGRLGRLPRGEVSSDWWTRRHVTAILIPHWSQRRPRAGEPGLQAGRQHHQGRQRHGASYRGRHPGGHQELHYH